MENRFFPNPSMFIKFSMKIVREGFKSIDLAIAVILVFVLFLENSLFFPQLAGMLICSIVRFFFVFRSHVPLPGPTTMWIRLVGTIKF